MRREAPDRLIVAAGVRGRKKDEHTRRRKVPATCNPDSRARNGWQPPIQFLTARCRTRRTDGQTCQTGESKVFWFSSGTATRCLEIKQHESASGKELRQQPRAMLFLGSFQRVPRHAWRDRLGSCVRGRHAGRDRTRAWSLKVEGFDGAGKRGYMKFIDRKGLDVYRRYAGVGMLCRRKVTI